MPGLWEALGSAIDNATKIKHPNSVNRLEQAGKLRLLLVTESVAGDPCLMVAQAHPCEVGTTQDWSAL